MADLPTVAHCATPFLELTMTWVHDQVRSLKRYRPVVLTQAVRNREMFPVPSLHTMESLTPWRQKVCRAIRKVRGTYAGYGPILDREGVRVIHAHFGQEGFRCLSARREAGVPMVTTFYGLDVSALPRESRWLRRLRRLFAQGERFLAEGSYMGGRLVTLGCPPEKVRIQRLGVDLSRIPYCPPASRSGKPVVVLMYAAFREKKGHVYGLRAFRRVADAYPTVQVRVIGDGPLRQEIEEEVYRLGLGNRVRLLGMQPHAACLEELRRATVLLYPSVTAADGDTEGGAPVALIEAMASGVPVVSSLHADIPEVVPDGRCGLLALERDVEGLAERLDAFLSSPGLRGEVVAAARAHVEVNHNLSTQVERLETIYDGLREG